MSIRRAEADEADSLTRLINSAFVPAEEFFVHGDRISVDRVREYFSSGIFLVTDDYGGCVYVELRGGRGYFGLLSVDPSRQGEGLAKQLIAAAEEYTLTHGCRFMDIRVVNLRTELPPVYRKLGYSETRTEPWPEDVPTKLPCHFICMTKDLGAG
jgi:GNAT superfamily N-acetyltransferase